MDGWIDEMMFGVISLLCTLSAGHSFVPSRVEKLGTRFYGCDASATSRHTSTG